MAEYVLAEDALLPSMQGLIESLQRAFRRCETTFFVIGAWARDLQLEHRHGVKLRRRTRDTDVAFAVAHWDMYDEIRRVLIDEFGFEKGTQAERLVAPQDGHPVDLVPFGSIEDDNHTLTWPPHHDRAMSTLGLREAEQTADTFALGKRGFSFRVASLPALSILKLIAWSEQPHKREKDAIDFASVLRHYYDINKERVIDEHLDLLREPDVDERIVSARLLGRDMVSVLKISSVLASTIIDILNQQTHDVKNSLLADQMAGIKLPTQDQPMVKRLVQQLKAMRQEIQAALNSR